MILCPIAPGCYLCGEHDELAGSPLLCRRCRPERPLTSPRKAREDWWNEPGDFPELVVPPDAPSDTSPKEDPLLAASKVEIEVSNDRVTWEALPVGRDWWDFKFMRRSSNRVVVFETRGLGQP
jgi:hypothetical protein